MEYPLISVLMPVYNVENFIEEAVTSITNQTYKNIELIIIDDCSTDSTYTKIQTLALKDKRIKLYKNDKNKKIRFDSDVSYDAGTGWHSDITYAQGRCR